MRRNPSWAWVSTARGLRRRRCVYTGHPDRQEPHAQALTIASTHDDEASGLAPLVCTGTALDFRGAMTHYPNGYWLPLKLHSQQAR